MTATTPPITAWYVLEVEGTGLASAQMARGEKTERRYAAHPAEQQRLLLLVPRTTQGCKRSPWRAQSCLAQCHQLDLAADESCQGGSKKREGSGGSNEEKQWPLVQAPAGSEPRGAPMVVLGALPG